MNSMAKMKNNWKNLKNNIEKKFNNINRYLDIHLISFFKLDKNGII